MPECSCGATVQIGMRCPQCGRGSFGSSNLPLHDYWELPVNLHLQNTHPRIPEYAKNLPNPSPVSIGILNPSREYGRYSPTHDPTSQSSGVSSPLADVRPTQHPGQLRGNEVPHGDSRPIDLPLKYQVGEIVVVESGDGFRFAVLVRDAEPQKRSFKVHNGSSRVMFWSKTILKQDPTSQVLRLPDVVNSHLEVLETLRDEGWIEFANIGSRWFANRFYREAS